MNYILPTTVEDDYLSTPSGEVEGCPTLHRCKSTACSQQIGLCLPQFPLLDQFPSAYCSGLWEQLGRLASYPHQFYAIIQMSVLDT